MPQPRDAFFDLRPPVTGGFGIRRRAIHAERSRDEEQQRGRHREGPGVEEERQRECHADEHASERRADEAVHHHLGAPEVAVGPFETLRFDDRGKDRLSGVVVEHLGHAEEQGGDEEGRVHEPVRGDVDAADDLVGGRQGRGLGEHDGGDDDRDERSEHVHREHQLAPVHAVGDHTGREREQEPGESLCHGDHGDEDRVAGDPGGEPRVGDHGDAVPEVRDDRRRPELPVVRTQPGLDLVLRCGHASPLGSSVGRFVG